MTKKLTLLILLLISSFVFEAQAHHLEYQQNDCAPPVNIQIVNVTSIGVEFSWSNATENEDVAFIMHQYVITTDLTPTPGPTTLNTQANSYEYITLTPGTTYNLFLRTLCLGTWSDWSAAVPFQPLLVLRLIIIMN